MKLDIHEKLRSKFEYIETMLLWGDGLTAGDLAETFGLSRQAAQEIIKKYRDYFKDSMVYDQNKKRQVASNDFKPHLIDPDPLRFLDYLRGQSLISFFRNEESWSDLEVTDTDRHLRASVNRSIIKTVIFALKNKKVIHICYSKKELKSENSAYRSISPNHMVFADNRYHIRAYCHKKNRYLDFVLTRILSAEITDQDWVSGNNDKEWHEYEEIHVIPNPVLPENTRDALLKGYESTVTGTRKIKCKKALSYYIYRSFSERIDSGFGCPLWIVYEK